jgi:hypothetical protein
VGYPRRRKPSRKGAGSSLEDSLLATFEHFLAKIQAAM